MYKFNTRHGDDSSAVENKNNSFRTNFQNGFSLIFIVSHTREGRCFLTRVLLGL